MGLRGAGRHSRPAPPPLRCCNNRETLLLYRKRINSIIAHQISRQPYLLIFQRQQAVARQPIRERAQPGHVVVGEAILDLATQRWQQQHLTRPKLPERLNRAATIETIRSGVGCFAPLGYSAPLLWLRRTFAAEQLLVGGAARGIGTAVRLHRAAPAGPPHRPVQTPPGRRTAAVSPAECSYP